MTDEQIWSLYYMTAWGWGQHPGNTRDKGTKLTIEEAAAVADRMLAEHKLRWGRH